MNVHPILFILQVLVLIILSHRMSALEKRFAEMIRFLKESEAKKTEPKIEDSATPSPVTASPAKETSENDTLVMESDGPTEIFYRPEKGLPPKKALPLFSAWGKRSKAG